MGGATADIHEILLRLNREHEARLFLPRFPWPFSRCRIAGQRPYPVSRLMFTPADWTPRRIVPAFRRAVERFRPDVVVVADGWHVKPFLFQAVEDFQPWVRVYAYENLCLVNNGTVFADGQPCGNHLLRDPDRCRVCARRQPPAGFCYRQEPWAANAHGAAYPSHVERMFRNARGIIVYNELTRAMVDRCNAGIRIIPSGVDTQVFAPDPEAGRAIPPLIFLPGRMADPVKGMDVVIAAADKLSAEGLLFSVVAAAVDKGWSRSYLHLTGWLSPRQMAPFYRRAAVTVVPSLWPEPQGIVAVESMACGTPVIASRIGGLPAVVEDGVTGFTFGPGNVEELADRLRLLLQDASLRARMGAAARAAAETRFDWDWIYEQYYRGMFARG